MKPFHVDLLLSGLHYFLIRNLATLVSPQTKSCHRKCRICPSCLGSYNLWQRYRRHMSLCKNDGTIFEIPESTSLNVSFYNFNNMVTALFVIYCNMEMYIQEEELVRRGKIVSHWQHVPISVAALMVCRDRPDLGSYPFLYTGTDCVDVLLDHLDSKVFCLRCVYESMNEPCCWYESQCLAHQSAEQCAMCLHTFSSDHIKVRDHCHISGWYRFALCSHCNLTCAKRPFKVIILFHGLSNYDLHFIVCNLAFCLL